MRILGILLDLNIILDFILLRQPFINDAKRIFLAHDKGRFQGYVAASSLPNLFYFARRDMKHRYGEAAATAQAYQAVSYCLDTFGLIALDERMIRYAMQQPGDDLEDQLQAAAALYAGLDAIVTRDKDFRRANIKSLTPAQLLKRL